MFLTDIFFICLIFTILYLRGSILQYLLTIGVIAKDYIVYSASKFQHRELYRPKQQRIENSIVISLTTNPKRLKEGIQTTLDAFQGLPILLNIPKLFRNAEPYDVGALEALETRYPNLTIHVLDEDYGPQTKLLGAFEAIVDPDIYILVIDDDVQYINHLVESYDAAIQVDKKSGGIPNYYGSKVEAFYGIPVSPGFASFCIRRGALPPDFKERVQAYAESSGFCKRHDDFLFGAVFQDLSIAPAKHVKTKGPLSLPIGFGLDALHTTEISAIKHYKCSESIWESRQMCRNPE
jgi:hypothetical protein